MKKIHLYIGTTVPNSQKKKKRDSGTGNGDRYHSHRYRYRTPCRKRCSGHSVLVPHLLVPVPSGGFWVN